MNYNQIKEHIKALHLAPKSNIRDAFIREYENKLKYINKDYNTEWGAEPEVKLKGAYKRSKYNTWFSKAYIDGKHVYLGSFKSQLLAHEAYKRADIKKKAVYCTRKS